MPREVVEVPLSVANIKQLTRQLKAFGRSLQDLGTEIEQTAGALIAARLRANIAQIADVDGNYLGTDDAASAVSVEVGLHGHDIIWRGKQIVFVEYGTGAAGVGYPGTMQGGYQPDPTKERWVYLDAKTNQGAVSHGLAPQAPMYTASIESRAVALAVAKAKYWKAVRSALTV